MASVDFTIEGRTARVHLNRPSALNAINGDMHARLADAWHRVNEDEAIWTVLLTAEGERAFCAGGDLTENTDFPDGLGFGGGLTGIGGELIELRKPLIAAVQGHAVGGGCEIALCADMIVAADNARFSLPEIPSGIIDHCGALHRVIRKLPYNLAMDMILTGRRLDAEEACRFGLVRSVVPAGDLAAKAFELCELVNRSSPLAASAAKQSLQAADGMALPQALGHRYPAIEAYRTSQDFNEAMTAWQGKRTPAWSGK